MFYITGGIFMGIGEQLVYETISLGISHIEWINIGGVDYKNLDYIESNN
jgi:hypothetical protein